MLDEPAEEMYTEAMYQCEPDGWTTRTGSLNRTFAEPLDYYRLDRHH